MAISRPFLLALLGAALLGATFFAVQNARKDAGDVVAPTVQQSQPDQAATPAASPKAPAASPKELLHAALNGSQLDSTAFSARLSVSAEGERASIDVSGAFEQGAANDVPKFEVSAEVRAAGEKLDGGFVSLGDEAYFTRGETGWRVPEAVWSPLVEAVEKGAASQPQSLSLPFDPENWIRDIESKGTETLDGVETTHIAVTVDHKRLVRDVMAAARATGGQLLADATGVVKRANLDAWIGTEDRIIRRLTSEVAFAGQGKLSVELELTGVNEAQDIEAPANVRRGMPDGTFGELAQDLVSGLSGVTGGDSVSLAALTSPNPRKAARAVKAGKKVVILFHNPRGLDDRVMTRVVRELDRRTQAVVLRDHVDAVDRYGEMVEDLGVSQTPSVVLIDRTGQARLIEGYADTDTLAQAVADAR